MHAQAQEPSQRAAPSSQRLGRYRLLTQLGEGGMGAIHLAVTAGLGEFEKLVVLKELKPDLSQNSEFVNMFLREVKLAGRLNHANIVQTIEAAQVGERYFMSMEFLDGQTFAKLLARASEKSKIPLRLRLQIICDVLAGLHYAHELKDYDGTPLSVVHCDVSFGNVFVTYEGQVKLVDFGVARLAESLGRNSGFQGKVRYAAPEQLTGEPVDRRADIYSAGIMLWEALALRRYTAGLNSDKAIIEARLKGTEPRIADVLPHVDRELAAICDRALERNPERRFATAQDFRLALASYLAKLGPRIDSSEIARIMTTEFAPERAEIHQLISAKLRDPAEASVSVAIPKVPGHDDVTTVADLSTLVDSISSSDSLVPPARLRRPAPGRWLLVGGVVLAVLATAAAIVLTKGPPGAPEPTSGERVGASPLAPAKAEGDAPPAVPSEPRPSAASRTTSPPGSPPANDDAPGPREEGESSSRDSSVPSNTRRSQRPSGSAPSPSTTGSSQTSDTTPGARPANPGFGQDLAPRPKAERPGIDAENPFK